MDIFAGSVTLLAPHTPPAAMVGVPAGCRVGGGMSWASTDRTLGFLGPDLSPSPPSAFQPVSQPVTQAPWQRPRVTKMKRKGLWLAVHAACEVPPVLDLDLSIDPDPSPDIGIRP